MMNWHTATEETVTTLPSGTLKGAIEAAISTVA